MTVRIDSLAWLRSDANPGYLRAPFPNSTDSRLIEILNESGDRLGALRLLVLGDHSLTLLCFAERVANQAVRENQTRWIELGLLAVGFEDGRSDPREDILVLALLNHSAEKLSADAGSLFAAAAEASGPTLRDLIRRFPERPATAKSLEAMGFREQIGPSGFFYERTW